MATATRTPRRPQDKTAGHVTVSVTVTPTRPASGQQAGGQEATTSRGGLSGLWHRVWMAIQEMNYAVRRLYEVQAFAEQSYREAQPPRPTDH
jgi:hypothetical protein